MLTLPTESAPVPAPSIDGTSFVITGPPKSGKSTLFNSWPECLCIDTQGGHRLYGGLVVNVANLADLREVAKQLVALIGKGPFPYKAVAVDTLDDISNWVEPEATAAMNRIHKKTGSEKYESIQEVPKGGGWLEHRAIMMRLVKTFLALPCVKLFGVHSRHLIGEEPGEYTKMIDLPGMLGQWVPAIVDSVGISYRTEDGRYMVSFEGYESITPTTKDKQGLIVKQGKKVVHAGSRFVNLNGKHVGNTYEAIVRAVEGGE